MRQNKWGGIVNISSIGGKVSMPLGGWYHASKFALEAMSDALRNEVRQFGIDVVVIEPGGVQSEWADIAVGNGLKNSGKGVYKTMTQKFAPASPAEASPPSNGTLGNTSAWPQENGFNNEASKRRTAF